MASTTQWALRCSRQCSPRLSLHFSTANYTAQWQRALSTTPVRLQDTVDTPTKKAPEQAPVSKKGASRALEKLAEDLKTLDPEVMKDFRGQINTTKKNVKMPQKRKAKGFEKGFWAIGDPSHGRDPNYYGDDLTSLGHGELQKHRELREYARLIAWELPLLGQLARPFEPPTAATPFRFRYTSYLGEKHPAANKVVVEFSVNDMKLKPEHRSKLIKLAGPRYNPETDIVKMSCESFDTQAQNKRFLGETIHKLLEESKTGDMFEDVPFDFRHHKPKKRHEFPKEWIMTPERRRYLEDKRAQMAKLDDEKLNNDQLVDGQKMIETSLRFETPEPEPVMVAAPRGKRTR